eukprot:scaffold7928_cov45-Phaeocystis_antarctica.AAC.1
MRPAAHQQAGLQAEDVLGRGEGWAGAGEGRGVVGLGIELDVSQVQHACGRGRWGGRRAWAAR